MSYSKNNQATKPRLDDQGVGEQKHDYSVNLSYWYLEDIITLVWERKLKKHTANIQFFCSATAKVDEQCPSLFAGEQGLTQQKLAGLVLKGNQPYLCADSYSLSLAGPIINPHSDENGLKTAFQQIKAWNQLAIKKANQYNLLKKHRLLASWNSSGNHWNLVVMDIDLVAHSASCLIYEPLYENNTVPPSLKQHIEELAGTSLKVTVKDIERIVTKQQQGASDCGAIVAENGDLFITHGEAKKDFKAYKSREASEALRSQHIDLLGPAFARHQSAEEEQNRVANLPRQQINRQIVDQGITSLNDFFNQQGDEKEQLILLAKALLALKNVLSSKSALSSQQDNQYLQLKQDIKKWLTDNEKLMSDNQRQALFNAFFVVNDDEPNWRDGGWDNLEMLLLIWYENVANYPLSDQSMAISRAGKEMMPGLVNKHVVLQQCQSYDYYQQQVMATIQRKDYSIDYNQADCYFNVKNRLAQSSQLQWQRKAAEYNHIMIPPSREILDKQYRFFPRKVLFNRARKLSENKQLSLGEDDANYIIECLFPNFLHKDLEKLTLQVITYIAENGGFCQLQQLLELRGRVASEQLCQTVKNFVNDRSRPSDMSSDMMRDCAILSCFLPPEDNRHLLENTETILQDLLKARPQPYDYYIDNFSKFYLPNTFFAKSWLHHPLKVGFFNLRYRAVCALHQAVNKQLLIRDDTLKQLVNYLVPIEFQPKFFVADVAEKNYSLKNHIKTLRTQNWNLLSIILPCIFNYELLSKTDFDYLVNKFCSRNKSVNVSAGWLLFYAMAINGQKLTEEQHERVREYAEKVISLSKNQSLQQLASYLLCLLFDSSSSSSQKILEDMIDHICPQLDDTACFVDDVNEKLAISAKHITIVALMRLKKNLSKCRQYQKKIEQIWNLLDEVFNPIREHVADLLGDYFSMHQKGIASDLISQDTFNEISRFYDKINDNQHKKTRHALGYFIFTVVENETFRRQLKFDKNTVYFALLDDHDHCETAMNYCREQLDGGKNLSKQICDKIITVIAKTTKPPIRQCACLIIDAVLERCHDKKVLPNFNITAAMIEKLIANLATDISAKNGAHAILLLVRIVAFCQFQPSYVDINHLINKQQLVVLITIFNDCQSNDSADEKINILLILILLYSYKSFNSYGNKFSFLNSITLTKQLDMLFADQHKKLRGYFFAKLIEVIEYNKQIELPRQFLQQIIGQYKNMSSIKFDDLERLAILIRYSKKSNRAVDDEFIFNCLLPLFSRDNIHLASKVIMVLKEIVQEKACDQKLMDHVLLLFNDNHGELAFLLLDVIHHIYENHCRHQHSIKQGSLATIYEQLSSLLHHQPCSLEQRNSIYYLFQYCSAKLSVADIFKLNDDLIHHKNSRLLDTLASYIDTCGHDQQGDVKVSQAMINIVHSLTLCLQPQVPLPMIDKLIEIFIVICKKPYAKQLMQEVKEQHNDFWRVLIKIINECLRQDFRNKIRDFLLDESLNSLLPKEINDYYVAIEQLVMTLSEDQINDNDNINQLKDILDKSKKPLTINTFLLLNKMLNANNLQLKKLAISILSREIVAKNNPNIPPELFATIVKFFLKYDKIATEYRADFLSFLAKTCSVHQDVFLQKKNEIEQSICQYSMKAADHYHILTLLEVLLLHPKDLHKKNVDIIFQLAKKGDNKVKEKSLYLIKVVIDKNPKQLKLIIKDNNLLEKLLKSITNDITRQKILSQLQSNYRKKLKNKQAISPWLQYELIDASNERKEQIFKDLKEYKDTDNLPQGLYRELIKLLATESFYLKVIDTLSAMIKKFNHDNPLTISEQDWQSIWGHLVYDNDDHKTILPTLCFLNNLCQRANIDKTVQAKLLDIVKVIAHCGGDAQQREAAVEILKSVKKSSKRWLSKDDGLVIGEIIASHSDEGELKQKIESMLFLVQYHYPLSIKDCHFLGNNIGRNQLDKNGTNILKALYYQLLYGGSSEIDQYISTSFMKLIFAKKNHTDLTDLEKQQFGLMVYTMALLVNMNHPLVTRPDFQKQLLAKQNFIDQLATYLVKENKKQLHLNYQALVVINYLLEIDERLILSDATIHSINQLKHDQPILRYYWSSLFFKYFFMGQRQYSPAMLAIKEQLKNLLLLQCLLMSDIQFDLTSLNKTRQLQLFSTIYSQTIATKYAAFDDYSLIKHILLKRLMAHLHCHNNKQAIDQCQIKANNNMLAYFSEFEKYYQHTEQVDQQQILALLRLLVDRNDNIKAIFEVSFSLSELADIFFYLRTTAKTARRQILVNAARKADMKANVNKLGKGIKDIILEAMQRMWLEDRLLRSTNVNLAKYGYIIGELLDLIKQVSKKVNLMVIDHLLSSDFTADRLFRRLRRLLLSLAEEDYTIKDSELLYYVNHFNSDDRQYCVLVAKFCHKFAWPSKTDHYASILLILFKQKWSLQALSRLGDRVKNKSLLHKGNNKDNKWQQLLYNIFDMLASYPQSINHQVAIEKILDEQPSFNWIKLINQYLLNQCVTKDSTAIERHPQRILDLFQQHNKGSDHEFLSKWQPQLIHDNHRITFIADNEIKNDQERQDCLLYPKHQSNNLRKKPLTTWRGEQIKEWALTVRKHHVFAADNKEFVKDLIVILNLSFALYCKEKGKPQTRLRNTQVVALLTFLSYCQSSQQKKLLKKRINEMFTGEGKSRVIVSLAVCLALRNKSVDIITSSTMLASRDAREFSSFYALFAISCADNRDLHYSDYGIKPCYKSDIVYGTIEQFQYDYLKTDASDLPVRKLRQYDCVIVDEVDNPCIDNGAVLAQISSSVANIKYLNQVLVLIWHQLLRLKKPPENNKINQLVASILKNCRCQLIISSYLLADISDVKGLVEQSLTSDIILQIDNDNHYEIHFFYKNASEQLQYQLIDVSSLDKKMLIKHVDKNNFFKTKDKLIPINSNDSKPLQQLLIDMVDLHINTNLLKQTIEKSVLACIEDSDDSKDEQKNEIKEDKNITADDQGNLAQKATNMSEEKVGMATPAQQTPLATNNNPSKIECKMGKIKLPKYFAQFCYLQLKQWIDSAMLAYSLYHPSKDYVIKFEQGKKLIVAVDFSNTGETQKNMQWDLALHQFIQLKHKASLMPLSLTNNYVSIAGYLNKYKEFFGLTGTLSQQDDRQLIRRLYGADTMTIPRFKPKLFLELPAIIAADLDQLIGGVVDDESDLWLSHIVDDAKRQVKRGKVVLIICETIAKARRVHGVLRQSQHRYHLSLYIRSDKPINPIEDMEFPEGRIIIATNLAGRGKDIKFSNAVLKNGGLHVIMTFLPANKRIEQQAFGRASRGGKPGSGRKILSQCDLYQQYNVSPDDDIEEIYRKRDALAKVTNDNNIQSIEHNLTMDAIFNKFCCWRNEFFDKQLPTSKPHVKGTNMIDNEMKPYLLHDINEQFGFWLNSWLINHDKMVCYLTLTESVTTITMVAKWRHQQRIMKSANKRIIKGTNKIITKSMKITFCQINNNNWLIDFNQPGYRNRKLSKNDSKIIDSLVGSLVSNIKLTGKRIAINNKETKTKLIDVAMADHFDCFSNQIEQSVKTDAMAVIKNPSYLLQYANRLLDMLENQPTMLRRNWSKQACNSAISQALKYAIELDQRFAYPSFYMRATLHLLLASTNLHKVYLSPIDLLAAKITDDNSSNENAIYIGKENNNDNSSLYQVVLHTVGQQPVNFTINSSNEDQRLVKALTKLSWDAVQDEILAIDANKSNQRQYLFKRWDFVSTILQQAQQAHQENGQSGINFLDTAFFNDRRQAEQDLVQAKRQIKQYMIPQCSISMLMAKGYLGLPDHDHPGDVKDYDYLQQSLEEDWQVLKQLMHIIEALLFKLQSLNKVITVSKQDEEKEEKICQRAKLAKVKKVLSDEFKDDDEVNVHFHHITVIKDIGNTSLTNDFNTICIHISPNKNQLDLLFDNLSLANAIDLFTVFYICIIKLQQQQKLDDIGFSDEEKTAFDDKIPVYRFYKTAPGTWRLKRYGARTSAKNIAIKKLPQLQEVLKNSDDEIDIGKLHRCIQGYESKLKYKLNYNSELFKTDLFWPKLSIAKLNAMIAKLNAMMAEFKKPEFKQLSQLSCYFTLRIHGDIEALSIAIKKAGIDLKNMAKQSSMLTIARITMANLSSIAKLIAPPSLIHLTLHDLLSHPLARQLAVSIGSDVSVHYKDVELSVAKKMVDYHVSLINHLQVRVKQVKVKNLLTLLNGKLVEDPFKISRIPLVNQFKGNRDIIDHYYHYGLFFNLQLNIKKPMPIYSMMLCGTVGLVQIGAGISLLILVSGINPLSVMIIPSGSVSLLTNAVLFDMAKVFSMACSGNALDLNAYRRSKLNFFCSTMAMALVAYGVESLLHLNHLAQANKVVSDTTDVLVGGKNIAHHARHTWQHSSYHFKHLQHVKHVKHLKHVNHLKHLKNNNQHVVVDRLTHAVQYVGKKVVEDMATNFINSKITIFIGNLVDKGDRQNDQLIWQLCSHWFYKNSKLHQMLNEFYALSVMDNSIKWQDLAEQVNHLYDNIICFNYLSNNKTKLFDIFTHKFISYLSNRVTDRSFKLTEIVQRWLQNTYPYLGDEIHQQLILRIGNFFDQQHYLHANGHLIYQQDLLDHELPYYNLFALDDINLGDNFDYIKANFIDFIHQLQSAFFQAEKAKKILLDVIINQFCHKYSGCYKAVVDNMVDFSVMAIESGFSMVIASLWPKMISLCKQSAKAVSVVGQTEEDTKLIDKVKQFVKEKLKGKKKLLQQLVCYLTETLTEDPEKYELFAEYIIEPLIHYVKDSLANKQGKALACNHENDHNKVNKKTAKGTLPKVSLPKVSLINHPYSTFSPSPHSSTVIDESKTDVMDMKNDDDIKINHPDI